MGLDVVPRLKMKLVPSWLGLKKRILASSLPRQPSFERSQLHCRGRNVQHIVLSSAVVTIDKDDDHLISYNGYRPTW